MSLEPLVSPIMKLLLDFLPVVVFFAVYKLYDDFYLATVAIIIATSLQVAWTWFSQRRVERMPLIALALLIVFGGITLVLHDEMFLKWKPTVVNWLFGAAFLASQFIGRKPLIQRMLDSAMSLPAAVWLRLNLAWTVFFVLMGVANLYVVYQFSTDAWVDFKLYGMFGLTLVFVIAQGFYLARHVQVSEES